MGTLPRPRPDPLPPEPDPEEIIGAPCTADIAGLSPRELEIARLVARGYPNKTVAAVLDLSPWTFATYLRRIYMKFGVRCRAAMVRELCRRDLER
jgi:DNA-binding CsgD family transcriptional regulator